jgi:hypothetical protein
LSIDTIEPETVKEKVKEVIEEEIDETNSTLGYLDNWATLMYFLKQDQFSLLYVYHEDDINSVAGLKEFKKTEKKLRGYANFIVIACHNENFKNEQTPMCQKEPNSGVFPLISGFVPPANRFNPYTKQIENNQEISFGNRAKTEKSISKFLTSNLQNYVTPITKSKDYDTQTTNSKKINKVVLFSEKSISPTLFKALASKFKDTLDFYFVDVTKLGKKVKKVGVETYPTIMVYMSVDTDGDKLSEQKTVIYEGNNDMQELVAFMTPYALTEKYDPHSGDKAQFQKKGPYTIVNYKNYTRGLIEDYRAQVVFFDKSYDKIMGKFEEVAEALHGPANIVFFDCSSKQAQKLVEEKFGVKKFPKIMVWSTGTVKKHDTALEISAATDANDIINIVSETEIKDKMREISDTMISSIILNNAVQLRLVTLAYLYEGDEDEVPLAFRSMSSNPLFEGKIEFVAMKNPNAMTMQQFQVNKLPIIISGIPPPAIPDPENPDVEGQLRTMIYGGDVENYFQLLDYNLGILNSVFPKVEDKEKEAVRTAEATTEFQEITSDNFDEICDSKKGLCVIGFLNDFLNTGEDVHSHLAHLEILQERNDESSSQFKYMWINGTCHHYLLDDFELSPMYLPSVIIYSPSQRKYSRMVNPFEKANLIDFEKSFEGSGKFRVIINDSPKDFAEKIQDLDCPNLVPEFSDFNEDNMLDKELEEEIMREILEEDKRKREELDLEKGEEKKPKTKKKSKKKKSKKH